ncbi:MAG TPA: SPFH domain-containing protein [Candidatus Udaeobacter sp.]|jgi:regulator of protease activity HflC (stomatin/prohibitin superfamily)|nr:SPFH domain-containing protein [Candidatus Udaeobacter sp.]
MIREKSAGVINGGVMLTLLLASLVGVILVFRAGVTQASTGLVLTGVLLFVVTVLGFVGLLVVSPGEARVLQLFGGYSGTVKEPGFWWTNPFTAPRRRVSLRVRNFESAKLKVNDHSGNPIEIAAVVVWQVVDTAEALFQVDDYNNFVKVQTEAALRNLATAYAYDTHIDGQISLRSATGEVAEHLKDEIQQRLSKAGVQVVEARISHLAYAPEIAQVMLQRQQASAIVAARQIIVDGAVGMVEMALDKLAAQNVVSLDEERKAAMVSNLLVVLCSERNAQPIVNAGTLYGG